MIPHELGKRAGTRLDPCAVTAPAFAIEPGQTRECTFVLGHGSSRDAARALARTALADVDRRERSCRAHWDALLDTITVVTPDPLFDVLVNRWLLYQTLACRLWARAGFYQAGGAFGFRDQLQDSMALAIGAPQLLRRQLLLCASRQFVEGDVQHWWHPPAGAGVRTRFSDDLLWLPFATAHYVDVTGDATSSTRPPRFSKANRFLMTHEDAYFVPRVSERAPLYEHCARAIDRSLAVGAHGLPLMGSGDWNDGLNRVGYQGRGETVWLGWFLCALLRHIRAARPAAERYRARRSLGKRARTAGAHALRTRLGRRVVPARVFDDGTPLGSSSNTECRIDLIAQAWAVLSDIATPDQQQSSMAAVGAAAKRRRERSDPHPRSAADARQARSRLHRRVSARRARERRAVLPRRRVGFDGTGGTRRRRRGVSDVHATEPRTPRRASAPRSALSTRTVCDRRRRLHARPVYRPRRMELVHRLGGVDVSRGNRIDLRTARRGGRISVTPQLPSDWARVQLTLRRDGRVHELIICAAWATRDIENATANGAARLEESEWLVLEEAGESSRHMVVLRASKHVAGKVLQAE